MRRYDRVNYDKIYVLGAHLRLIQNWVYYDRVCHHIVYYDRVCRTFVQHKVRCTMIVCQDRVNYHRRRRVSLCVPSVSTKLGEARTNSDDTVNFPITEVIAPPNRRKIGVQE